MSERKPVKIIFQTPGGIKNFNMVSWYKSMNAKLDHDKEIREEVKRILNNGGKLEEGDHRTKNGKLHLNGVKPKVNLGKKSLRRIGYNVNQVVK